LFTIFARGAHFLWCPKNRWSPSLGASVALKIDKNELKGRSLWLPEVGGLIFTKDSQSNSS
jgi:hypothetical protein